MSLPHFFAGAPEPGEAVVLEPEDAHHAIRSLRLRPGDGFTSSDGRGAVVRCRVVRAERLLVEGEVVERTEEALPVPSLAVLLAPPKGDRFASAVQKLAEVGVDDIVLVEATRGVRRWEGQRAERVVARMDAVAREAAKQCRRRTLPRVGGPAGWSEAIEEAIREGPAVVLWEEASGGLLDLLPAETPERLTLVVGPEGGIPEEDARAAEAEGALLASLGPNLLRVDTAATVGAALTLGRYGRMG